MNIKQRLIEIKWLKRERELKLALLEHQAMTPEEYIEKYTGQQSSVLHLQMQALHPSSSMYGAQYYPGGIGSPFSLLGI